MEANRKFRNQQQKKLRQTLESGKDISKAMLPDAEGIVNYWSKRTIGGLLLMPPTRHCFLCLNEARRIKERL